MLCALGEVKMVMMSKYKKDLKSLPFPEMVPLPHDRWEAGQRKLFPEGICPRLSQNSKFLEAREGSGKSFTFGMR